MKKSKAETALTRKRIIEVAVQAFKANGIQATGVAEIMQAAGLTHGAFYRHFESKEQLVCEACAASMDVLLESAENLGDTDASYRKQIDYILSAENRDDCVGGCPLAAMGSELVRADAETRKVVSERYLEVIEAMASRGPNAGTKAGYADAVFALCSMIGAITMSRIIDDPVASAQILDVARKRLVPARSGPAAKKTVAAARRVAPPRRKTAATVPA